MANATKRKIMAMLVGGEKRRDEIAAALEGANMFITLILHRQRHHDHDL
jgi:hypothetical protein